jgi:predicted nucleic acid-binding protein
VKVLFDTNVVLDVLLSREPYLDNAIALFDAVEKQIIQGYLCATTITTVDYLATKALGKAGSKIAIGKLLELFVIAEVNRRTLTAALSSDFSDFEDAVLFHAGFDAGVDNVVTRNGKDFKTAELPIYSPDELLKLIQSSQP